MSEIKVWAHTGFLYADVDVIITNYPETVKVAVS